MLSSQNGWLLKDSVQFIYSSQLLSAYLTRRALIISIFLVQTRQIWTYLHRIKFLKILIVKIKWTVLKTRKEEIWLPVAKDQLKSEWIYEVIVSSKIPTKNYRDFWPGSLLEVSKSRKQIIKSQILPKTPQFAFEIYWPLEDRAKISVIFGWDFGRNDDLINSFWILLTFRSLNRAIWNFKVKIMSIAARGIFPIETLEKILFYLDGKSLLRMRSVSSVWQEGKS